MDPFKGRTRLRQWGHDLVNLRRRGENFLQVLNQERDSVILKLLLLFLLNLFDDLIQWNLDFETLDLEHSLDLEHWVPVTKSDFMI